jgi:hypothetical protein
MDDEQIIKLNSPSVDECIEKLLQIPIQTIILILNQRKDLKLGDNLLSALENIRRRYCLPDNNIENNF